MYVQAVESLRFVRCVSTWEEHYDLHDTPHVSNGRLPLASARKTEVYPIWINLWVALFDAL